MNKRIRKKFTTIELTKPIIRYHLGQSNMKYKGCYKKYIRTHAYNIVSELNKKYGENHMIHAVTDRDNIKKIVRFSILSNVQPVAMSSGIELDIKDMDITFDCSYGEKLNDHVSKNTEIGKLLQAWSKAIN